MTTTAAIATTVSCSYKHTLILGPTNLDLVVQVLCEGASSARIQVYLLLLLQTTEVRNLEGDGLDSSFM